MKKEKYLTLEEKIKIENQCFVLLPDVLTPEERKNICKMSKEEYILYDKNVITPRIKKTIDKINKKENNQ